MISVFLLAALLQGGNTGAAAPAVPVPPTAAAAGIESLQLRLLAAQQVIATLERQLADEHNRAAALDQARLRNGHLVSIARQLVDAYEKRYGMGRSHDPIQLGRRRLEFELQALSEAIYDMNADIPLSSLPGGEAVASRQSAPAPPATAASPDTGTAPSSDTMVPPSPMRQPTIDAAKVGEPKPAKAPEP